MTAQTRPTYQALINAALDATDAASGWLLAAHATGLRVVAASGAAVGVVNVNADVGASGARGFVLSSGQPTALMPQASDTANDGAGGTIGVPGSVLAAPCGEDPIVGVIEVATKANGQAFGFDDIEAISTLAQIASAALTEDNSTVIDVTPPAQLARELEGLAGRDPERYAVMARVIDSLLGSGA